MGVKKESNEGALDWVLARQFDFEIEVEVEVWRGKIRDDMCKGDHEELEKGRQRMTGRVEEKSQDP